MRSSPRLGWSMLASVLVAGALVSGCSWLIGVTEDPYIGDDDGEAAAPDASDARADTTTAD